MSGNPNTNSQTDAARIPNRDSRPGVPPSAIEVENKLKEAQAKLMEAEGKLMASTPTANARQEPSRSASDRTPNAGSAPRGVDTNDTRAQAPRTEASPNGSSVTREPERKETLGERVGNAAANVSAEMRAHAPAVPPTEHLTENVAATLCYLLGWVSGFVFLLIDRRPFVRFHAAQSVAVFATLSIVLLALGGFFLGALVPGMHVVLLALSRIVELGWLAAAVFLMLKASSGERYRIPGASEYADRAARQGR